MSLFFKRQKHFTCLKFFAFKGNSFGPNFCVKKLRKLLNDAVNQNIGNCGTEYFLTRRRFCPAGNFYLTEIYGLTKYVIFKIDKKARSLC
jgi:hypothetical protein